MLKLFSLKKTTSGRAEAMVVAAKNEEDARRFAARYDGNDEWKKLDRSQLTGEFPESDFRARASQARCREIGIARKVRAGVVLADLYDFR